MSVTTLPDFLKPLPGELKITANFSEAPADCVERTLLSAASEFSFWLPGGPLLAFLQGAGFHVRPPINRHPQRSDGICSLPPAKPRSKISSNPSPANRNHLKSEGTSISRNLTSTLFHHKHPGHPSQTTNRPSATIVIDLCVRAEVCLSPKTAPEAAQPHLSALFENTNLGLSAGVSLRRDPQ